MQKTIFTIQLVGLDSAGQEIGGQNTMATKELSYFVPLTKGDEVEDSMWHDPRTVDGVRFDIGEGTLYVRLKTDKSKDFQGLKRGYEGHDWKIAY